MTVRHAIILAAGKGTRMRSSRPKVLHEVGGRTMLGWSVALAKAAGCQRIVVVVGPDFPEVRAAAVKLVGEANVAVQHEALGTAHAVDAARSALAQAEGRAIVLYADTPLIPVEAVEQAFSRLDTGASVCVLGFQAADPGRYGRLIRGADGALERIVEANDATDAELAVRFCNSGVMAAPVGLLFDLIAEVGNANAKGEYYLTDIVGLARARGLRAAAAECAESDVLGVNSQAELAVAESVFQAAFRRRAMVEGVTLQAPETAFFCHDTRLAQGVTIEPHVVFGPGVTVEADARIRAFSHLEGCRVGAAAVVGPYARLRPGADIGPDAHIGNFVEVKNVTVGRGAKANHLSYLGDGEVGPGANIGAGTIFCNYDGFFKFRTVVGEGAFVGSNSALVAPVTIGKGAFVGSGSVVTDNVPDNALAIARGRQAVREDWATGFRDDRKALKAAGKKPDGAI